MKDKIKEKLKTLMDKTSVSERTVEDLADILATVVTTDEILESFDYSKLIKSVDGNINAVVSKAVKPVQKEEPVKLADGQVVKTELDEFTKLKNDLENLKNELQSAKIAKLETERSFKFKENISKLPDNIKNVFEKSYAKMKFSEDETEFDTYLTEIQADIAGLVQTNNLNGLNGQAPSAVVKPIVSDGQDSILASALNTLKEQK